MTLLILPRWIFAWLLRVVSQFEIDKYPIMIVHRTYRFDLRPTRQQYTALADILESQRHLYNAALQERIDAYRLTGKSPTKYDQSKSLTICRKDLPEMAIIPANLQRATLKRLDLAFAGFFSRLKTQTKAGFPRFKGQGWWSSFGFEEFSGLTFKNNHIKFKGLPGKLKVHMHRPLPEDAKIHSVTFKRHPTGKWTVNFQISFEKTALDPSDAQVGLDMGLSSLLVDNTGFAYENPRHFKKAQKELRRRQRALSRCKRGSNNRKKAKFRVAKWHAKIARQRETYLHQISTDLVNRYGLIAIEDLNVKGLSQGILAKSVHDVAWGRLIQMLTYKAESAGRQLICVDTRNTTQACSGCGVLVPKGLSVRIHMCDSCGLILDRDENAARNILQRAVVMSLRRQTRDCSGLTRKAC